MRRLFVLFLAVSALSSLVFAQKEAAQKDPNAEVFIGYSYMRSNLQNFNLDNSNLNGFQLQGTRFIKRNFGLTADFTRTSAADVHQTGVDVTRYTYLFGPTIAAHTKSSVAPFAHVLVGLDHERLGISNKGAYGDNSFAAAFGGGFDVMVTKNVWVRPAQFDYIRTNHLDGENHFRYSAGLVLKF